jgi:hypothetical protein
MKIFLRHPDPAEAVRWAAKLQTPGREIWAGTSLEPPQANVLFDVIILRLDRNETDFEGVEAAFSRCMRRLWIIWIDDDTTLEDVEAGIRQNLWRSAASALSLRK